MIPMEYHLLYMLYIQPCPITPTLYPIPFYLALRIATIMAADHLRPLLVIPSLLRV